MKTGIYKITNTTTGKVYIGSAASMPIRFAQHKHHLNQKTHPNRKLQNSWNKYGAEVFEFAPIIICAKENLAMYEQLCIDGYDAVDSGYNICLFVGSSRGIKRTEEHKRKIGESIRKRMQTPETKARMSEARRKRPAITTETRAKMSESQKGKTNALGTKWTVEARQRHSELKRSKTLQVQTL